MREKTEEESEQKRERGRKREKEEMKEGKGRVHRKCVGERVGERKCVERKREREEG